MNELQTYIQERNRALEAMDLDWARAQMAGMPNAIDDETLRVAMHMARYECTQIEPALRQASRCWLQTRGHLRTGGMPWPTDNSLEE